MNILVIRETNPFYTSNATNNRFLSLAEGLVENGCDIELLICNGYYHKSEKIMFNDSGTYNRIKYKYLLPVNYSNIITRQFYYRIFPNRYLEIKISKQLKTNKYDFIWLDFGPKVIQISSKIFETEISSKYFHDRNEFSWIGFSGYKKLHDKYLKEFLPKIDVLSIMTVALSNYYKNIISNKTRMLHLPMTVDLMRFQKTIADNKINNPYIAYCGSMSNSKDGVDILVKSFLKIIDRFPDLHLYIAGQFIPKRDYLIQCKIIKEANSEKRITYLGNLTKEEIPTFLSNATVLAMARPESKQAEGGFPTKLGEYLATGKPVCVTNVGEIGNYLKDNESAFIAKPGSVASFADALVRALTSSEAHRIGVAGRNVANRYFNKDIQATTLYKYLLNNK